MTDFALHATDVHISYDEKPVLENINIRIQPKSINLIMGPSGSGKTSLLRVLSGQETATRGSILINGKPLHEKSPNDKLGILFQSDALLLNLTVFENIALPLRYHTQNDETTIQNKVSQRLQEIGLPDTENLYPEQLSGGMSRRVAIARATILNPNFIFFDEPFAGQDPLNIENLCSLIQRMNTLLEATTIIVSHEPAIASKLADRIYLLHNQSIRYHGTPKELAAISDPFLQRFIIHHPNENKGSNLS